MWAKVESGSITEIYTSPKSITIDNVKYPRNIFQDWSVSELKALGIYSVVQDTSNLKNSEYYINGNASYNFSSDTVTLSYASATAKPLTDTLFTAEDEAADSDHVEGTVKSRGLKSEKKTEINGTANGLLQETDWMVIREADGGTAMPSNIKTYRAAVRTKANEMCTKIDNASDIDALAALYVYNDDSPPVRPLGEWPTRVV